MDIGVVGAEQGLDAFNGQHLDLVDVFAAAVVAFTGVALGIFVGEHRALRLYYARAGVVFRGNQLDVLFLSPLFFANSSKDLIVEPFNGHVVVKHGGPLINNGAKFDVPPESGAFYLKWPAQRRTRREIYRLYSQWNTPRHRALPCSDCHTANLARRLRSTMLITTSTNKRHHEQ